MKVVFPCYYRTLPKRARVVQRWVLLLVDASCQLLDSIMRSHSANNQFLGTFAWDKFASNRLPFDVTGLPDVLYHRGSSCSLEAFLVFRIFWQKHFAGQQSDPRPCVLFFEIAAFICKFGLWWNRISSSYNSRIQVTIAMLVCHAHPFAVEFKTFSASRWVLKRQHPKRCFLGFVNSLRWISDHQGKCKYLHGGCLYSILARWSL